jgi:hypothetical protein
MMTVADDALFPRPGRDDADAPLILSDWCPDLDDAESLRILSDQFEELGRDASAALLRAVAGRIERGVETYKRFAELLYFDNASMRSRLDHIQRRSGYDDAMTRAHSMAVSIGDRRGELETRPPAGDIPDRDTPAAP